MKKKQEVKLIRSFGLGMAVILIISSIIGSGIFKKVGPMAEVLGSSHLVVLAWVLAGLIVLAGVVGVAELASVFPDSGGPYMWFEKIYGKMMSFLYGWSCFTVIQTAALASVAFVFAGALNTFVPLPHLAAEWENMSFLGIHLFDNIGAKIVTSVMIIGLTAANIRGAKNGGIISTIFTLLIVLCIALIIISAFGSGQGNWQTFSEKSSVYPTGGFTVTAFIIAMFIAIRHAFFAFEGWMALGFIGEEVKNPEKNLPKALIYGILAIMLIYVLINTAYLYVMPVRELIESLSADQNNIAAVLVMNKIFGENGAYIIAGMILISTFGCTNATILMSARVYYAMAREGWFFKSAAQVHHKYKTPHKALIYQCVWACILTFSGSFDLLSDLVVISAFIFYGMIVVGVLVLRKKQPDLKRPYKAFGYPVIPLLFGFFCLVLLVVSFIESPGKATAGILLVISGLPFYYYWKSKQENPGLPPEEEMNLP